MFFADEATIVASLEQQAQSLLDHPSAVSHDFTLTKHDRSWLKQLKLLPT